MRMLHDPESIRMAVARHFVLFLVLFVVMLAAFLTSVTSGRGGMVLLIDQIVVPVLYFLLLLSHAARGQGLVVMLRTLMLSLVALVCGVAVLQWITGSVIFFQSGFSTQYWFARDSGRWMGTLDQPLALSLVICVAAPLVIGIGRPWLQAALLGLMSVGMLISQSRVGLASLAVSIFAVLIFTRRPVWVKSAMLVVMAGGGAAIMASPLIAGVAARLSNDTGSTEARGLALEYYLSRWADYALAGDGIGSSYRVAAQAGLETSLENPTLMYGIDIGVVFAGLYFGSMLVLLARYGRRTGYPGLMLAGIMALAIPQTYSSLATRSAAGIVVWTVFAMVVIAADEARERSNLERARVPAADPAPMAGDLYAPELPGSRLP
ncbi:hypothetical protein [Arthrobacter sp. PAMC25284]|uniref:hypothetical protein n=1 Tax=Arthrobacter sp. PAMC25284 TaxID=2861279 RepID=UPI001C63B265|nr:hypothetical protein [Arthrobacter sp. PAMC25284]QYF90889.1 hypothetical protein KY499_06570 [Arthrobacter sp. PAMC25284]